MVLNTWALNGGKGAKHKQARMSPLTTAEIRMDAR